MARVCLFAIAATPFNRARGDRRARVSTLPFGPSETIRSPTIAPASAFPLCRLYLRPRYLSPPSFLPSFHPWEPIFPFLYPFRSNQEGVQSFKFFCLAVVARGILHVNRGEGIALIGAINPGGGEPLFQRSGLKSDGGGWLLCEATGPSETLKLYGGRTFRRLSQIPIRRDPRFLGRC